MDSGLMLLLIGCGLAVFTVLLAGGYIPGFRMAWGGATVNASARQRRGASRIHPMVANFSICMLFVVSLFIIGTGAYIVVVKTGWELAQAAEANRNKILSDLIQPPSPTPAVTAPVTDSTLVVPAPSMTPAPGSVEPSPSPGASPVPTPPVMPDAARALFSQAFVLDQAGRNDEAIALYVEALALGLEEPSKSLAELEIGLLDLVLLKDGRGTADAERCSRAQDYLQRAESAEDTRSDASSALEEVTKLCG
jgi:hypothetical protein